MLSAEETVLTGQQELVAHLDAHEEGDRHGHQEEDEGEAGEDEGADPRVLVVYKVSGYGQFANNFLRYYASPGGNPSRNYQSLPWAGGGDHIRTQDCCFHRQVRFR